MKSCGATRPVSCARSAVQGGGGGWLRWAARSSRSLARSLSSVAHADILVPISPLIRSLALHSLARSPLARLLALHSLARSLTVTHRRTGVTVRHGLLRTALSLASSPLDRSLSAGLLARSPLARSLSGCRTATHRHTGVTPARATAGTSPANCNCHASAA